MFDYASQFVGSSSCCIASRFTIFCSLFWFLGNSFSPAIAVSPGDRITGAQAVERMSAVLGSPDRFASHMKDSTQDFIADHFGSMAIACAFGIAIRMRS
jgi:hypothetical protein